MKVRYFCLFFFSCLGSIYSQFHQNIFPNLEGEALLNMVVSEYKPQTVLGYNEARDIMYSDIYNHNDSVYCIYTNYALFLPESVDPSSYLWMNGNTNGINCEHAYPRSKGASEENGNAYSDMHHLFPTRSGVNNARDNFPFANIPDNETTNWYRESLEQATIPTNHIDEYSEKITGFFEPRETSKGNIARAMFYFYTMYQSEADEADFNYFQNQQETLCNWHFQDAVDENEWQRNFKIAEFQNDNANPFILDCSLASRTYCPQSIENCPTTTAVSNSQQQGYLLDIFPNPSINAPTLLIISNNVSPAIIKIYNALGIEQFSTNINLKKGENKLTIPKTHKGFGVIEVTFQSYNKLFKRVVFK